jgi:drug/metabolite transporter (DMT)-like permease
LQVWLYILCLGVFCTALGYILFFQILSSSGATNVALVTFLIPISATFLSWLILGEQLHGRNFAGMAFISLGLASIDGRLWEKFKAASKS